MILAIVFSQGKVFLEADHWVLCVDVPVGSYTAWWAAHENKWIWHTKRQEWGVHIPIKDDEVPKEYRTMHLLMT